MASCTMTNCVGWKRCASIGVIFLGAGKSAKLGRGGEGWAACTRFLQKTYGNEAFEKCGHEARYTM